MNTRAKGFMRERQAEKMLIEEGWTVQRVKGSTMWNKNVDFFGLFDLIAIRPRQTSLSATFDTQTMNQVLEFKAVQVKSNRKPKLDEYREFANRHRGVNATFEVWVFKDNAGVEKYEV